MNIYFGENIKKMRKARGLTQEEFANDIGVSFQTVSKWERGDSYPDITMLPVIAGYFDTTVDDLLGVDRSKRELKANEYVSMFDEMGMKDGNKVLKEYEKAVREFPHDHRIAVRYLSLLIRETPKTDKTVFEKASKKIEAVFNKIQDNCTDDGIRIWAKSLMIKYLRYRYDCFGYDETYRDQALSIIDTMPALCDSKEYLSTVWSDSSDWKENHENAIEELLYLLQNALIGYCYTSDKFTVQYKIGIILNMIGLFKTVDSDGRYSKNRIHLISCYGRLGRYYFEIGDNDNSIKYLTLAAKAAVEFDANNDDESVFRYYESTGVFKNMDMKKRMKELMLYHCNFTDEFKSTDAFKKVLSLLGADGSSERIVY